MRMDQVAGTLLSFGLYLAHAAVLPLLLVGFVGTAKARLQNRLGPSVLQPFYDVLKLLRKGETISETCTWVFRSAPTIGLAATLAASLMIPWLGIRSPIPGDLFLVIYLMALAKFASGLAAVDAGSAFGALGASREAVISVQAEPALALALVALAARVHSSSFTALLAPGQSGLHLYLVLPLLVAALWLTITAELARMPIDDPTTHLELTMVHEALILENSGRNLAIVELSVGLKMAILFGVLAQVIQVPMPPLPGAAHYVVSVGLIFAAGALLAVLESTLVKVRWRRIPNLLSFGLAAAVIACLIVAVKR